MIRMYCRGTHRTRDSLCQDCAELSQYAARRAESCPFKDRKPTCARCTVHCYDASHRHRIRAVMRYSGPRMSYRHPILAVRHFADGRRRPIKNEVALIRERQ